MRIIDWSSDVCSSDLILVHLELHAPAASDDHQQAHDVLRRAAEIIVLRQQLRLEGGVEQLCLLRGPRPIHDRLPRRTKTKGMHRAEIGRASCGERVCQYV